MKVRILLAALGLFALISGALKGRERVSSRMGGAGLGALEAVAGIVLVVSQVPGLANQGLRIGLGWATLGLMIVSNVYAVFRASGFASARRDSEGHRLYTQLKFQEALARAESGVDEKAEPDDAESETAPPRAPRPPSESP